MNLCHAVDRRRNHAVIETSTTLRRFAADSCSPDELAPPVMHCSRLLCLLLLPLILPGLVRGTAARTPAEPLSVMSYNILYDSPKWGADFAWSRRQPQVAALLQRHPADVIGLQEVHRGQLPDLQGMLPEHDVVGAIPGADTAEDLPWIMNPVFFRRDRLQVLATGFAWLTATDARGIPQLGWPEHGIIVARPAHAVWSRFLDRSSDEVFYHINLHLPPQSPPARERAAAALILLLRSFEPDRPVVVSGDYNASAEPALELLFAHGLNNARALSRTTPTGPTGTKINRTTGSLGAHPIDHIFVSQPVHVQAFATIDDRFSERHPSDHLPIVARLQFTRD